MPAPNLVYHYTTPQGLQGIMPASSHGGLALWASDAAYLNDSREIRHGLRSLANLLASQATAHINGRPHVMSDPEYSVGIGLKTLCEALNAPGAMESVYVACFCENGDLLSQWRGYAAGSGVALGFSSDSLATLDHDISLLQVHYGGELHDLEARAVEQAIESIRVGRVLSEVARDLVAAHLVRVKHPAFAEEREWRLVSATNAGPSLKIRPGSVGIVPYVTLSVPPEALRHVIIGPGQHSELRVRAMERYLEQHAIDARVDPSAIPYRA